MVQEHVGTTHQLGDQGRTGRTSSRARRLLTIVYGLLALVVLLGCYFASQLGFLNVALYGLLLVWICGTLIGRVWAGYRKTLEWGLLRHPFSRKMRPYLRECLNRWACWLLVAWMLHLIIVPLGVSPDQYRQVQVSIWGCTGVLMVLALVPAQRTRHSTNLLYTAGWVLLGIEIVRIMHPPALAASAMIELPVRGEWYVAQGGTTPVINHHYGAPQQRYAVDLTVARAGMLFQGDPAQLESYYAFGQPLYAPAAGRVVKVVADLPDVPIGQTDTTHHAGNHVVIDTGQSQFVMLGHLRQGSVQVTEGSDVAVGELIAECGNSGNTSFPHLHLQIQNGADYDDSQLQTIPIVFRNIIRVRGGHARLIAVADVRRNDQVISVE